MFSLQTNFKRIILSFLYCLNQYMLLHHALSIYCHLVSQLIKLLFEEVESFYHNLSLLHAYYVKLQYAELTEGSGLYTTHNPNTICDIIFIKQNVRHQGLRNPSTIFLSNTYLSLTLYGFPPSGDLESMGRVLSVKLCSQPKQMSQNPIERCCRGKKADTAALAAESWASPLTNHSTQAAIPNQPGSQNVSAQPKSERKKIEASKTLKRIECYNYHLQPGIFPLPDVYIILDLKNISNAPFGLLDLPAASSQRGTGRLIIRQPQLS